MRVLIKTKREINEYLSMDNSEADYFAKMMHKYCSTIIDIDENCQILNKERWVFKNWMIEKEITKEEYPEYFL